MSWRRFASKVYFGSFGYAHNAYLGKYRAVTVETPSQTPFLEVGVSDWGRPQPTDKLPDNFFRPFTGRDPVTNHYRGDMAIWCLERHGKGINMVIMDGSVQHLRPRQLWTLDWYETFQEERTELLQQGGSPE